MTPPPRTIILAVALAGVLGLASRAQALPVQLKDQNGTRYNINTDVDPLINNSFASGAITDATYEKPVTITSYYLGLTPFGFFFTTYTVQRQINVPLTNAFAGFNGLVITGANGVALASPVPYNPGEGLAAEDCPQNNANRQLTFQTQAFPALNLALARKVFVPHNGTFARWLNIVTNTGSAAQQVGITLQGTLGSLNQTKVTATSTGDSTITAADLWWTTSQIVPQGQTSLEPRVGFAVQGAGAQVPPRSLGINSVGQAIATYTPTIEPGATVIVMTFVSVQGNNKQVKNTMENVVSLPSKAIACLSETELSQVINFAHITPPQLKKATIQLNFKKEAADTVQWKGSITIGAGISLEGLPVTVDVGGATGSFVLNKKGKGNAGGGNKFSIDAKLKNGVTKAATVNFSFNLKGDFKETLAGFGLTDATVDDVPVTVPVTITAGPGVFSTDQPFTYNAKQGKSGTAKAS
jgi:hypothetical protein